MFSKSHKAPLKLLFSEKGFILVKKQFHKQLKV